METYYIHEANLERLEKKLATIEKKCNASHCTFTYNITGTEYRTAEDADGNEYTAKYFVVEVDGTAKYNGWRFVATLDHHEEGNVVRAFDKELTIPDKYKSCGPTCEHCNKIRSRKDTYLIYNDETKEFKQVGKSCLAEFTNGLSAEDVAFFCSIYEKVESAYSYSGSSFTRYIEIEHILRYAFECYKHWGYQKAEGSYADENGYLPIGYRSTRTRVTDYYYIKRRMSIQQEQLKAEMEEVGFNPDSEYAVETTKAALEWIRNEKDLNNEYIRNLHVICSEEYTDYRSLGILVSLPTAYERHLGKIAAYEKKEKAKEEEKKNSEFVGEIGSKIEVNPTSIACVSSWPTNYGMTFLYKWTDADNNIYIWYASKPIEDDNQEVLSIKGTIKDHSEYNGVKQTVMTRCKVTLAPPEKKDEIPEGFVGQDDPSVADAVDEFLKVCNS